MPMFVVAVMAQLVLCGGMIPVTRPARARPAVLVHARSVGLCRVGVDGGPDQACPRPPASNDSFWKHTPKRWIFDMGMLGVLCIGYATFVRWKIRLKGE